MTAKNDSMRDPSGPKSILSISNLLGSPTHLLSWARLGAKILSSLYWKWEIYVLYMGGGGQKDAEFSTSEIFYYKLSELLPTKSRSLSELSKYFSSGKLSSYILKEKLLGGGPQKTS